jgi:hypothetical protein
MLLLPSPTDIGRIAATDTCVNIINDVPNSAKLKRPSEQPRSFNVNPVPGKNALAHFL